MRIYQNRKRLFLLKTANMGYNRIGMMKQQMWEDLASGCLIDFSRLPWKVWPIIDDNDHLLVKHGDLT